MTTGGWVFMLLSLAIVIALVSYCYIKVMTHTEAADHMQAPLDIDTRDRGT